MARASLANNAVSTLAAAITSTSATTLTVTSAATFPAITGGQYFYCTLLDSANIPEIVKVTAVASNVFTIVRAQDNTAARTFLIGAKVSLNITAAVLNELVPVDGTGATGSWPINVTGSAGSATGNAGTVTNGVYTTGSYSDPAWITALAGAKVTGTVPAATNATKLAGATWTVEESGGILYFKSSGVNRAKLDASGNLTVLGNVTAYGTV